jgi:hypothetical protein
MISKAFLLIRALDLQAIHAVIIAKMAAFRLAQAASAFQDPRLSTVYQAFTAVRREMRGEDFLLHRAYRIRHAHPLDGIFLLVVQNKRRIRVEITRLPHAADIEHIALPRL